NDLPVRDTVNADSLDLHRLAGRRHAHQPTVIGAHRRPTGDDEVALGDLLLPPLELTKLHRKRHPGKVRSRETGRNVAHVRRYDRDAFKPQAAGSIPAGRTPGSACKRAGLSWRDQVNKPRERAVGTARGYKTSSGFDIRRALLGAAFRCSAAGRADVGPPSAMESRRAAPSPRRSTSAHAEARRPLRRLERLLP